MAEEITAELTFKRWVLDSIEKMHEAYVDFHQMNYSVILDNGPETPTGERTHTIQIVSGQGADVRSYKANIGQVIVMIGTNIESMTQDDYQQRYGSN
jgi:hypothetical protein